ncbi:MAG: HAMP domain-containing histidine kinase [candidate division WOR-3 bacterium]|nr:HAMP domain-containing histidine kinase [candidate division WOR-3 bacterium]
MKLQFRKREKPDVLPATIGFTSRTLVIYFLIGIGLIGIGTYLYSTFLMERIRKETETISRIFASYVSGPGASEEELLALLFREVIEKIDFPVVLTDVNGTPYSAKNVSDTNLTDVVKKLDREHPPIPILVRTGSDSTIVGYVHYGLSPFTKSLKILPFLMTAFLLAFLFLGFWGYLIYRKSEEEKIWYSLAKETAHQLATPLSSLSGWLETLRRSVAEEIYEGIAEDAQRMKEVLEKFSRIGMPPRLIEKDPMPVIQKAVNYIKRRAHNQIQFIENYQPLPLARFDDILLDWAVENLLKNGLDAIGSKPGTISIKTQGSENGVIIEISDTGPGIKQARDIFKPGYTTKKYGWGLGLVLTKRIIEEYHRGKLTLKKTGPGGTTFQIYIPAGVEK